MENKDLIRMTQFLFEVGTMRKLARMHRQALFTDDMSDNIATHTFRVMVIGFFLAKMEKVDPIKVLMMCLLHDMPESRTNDHNWIHKRYVKEFENEAIKEQLSTLPFQDFYEIALEYEKRESLEAIVAKDADVLDQILLLREYAWQGNREAQMWLDGKREKIEYNYLKYVKTKSAKALGRVIYDEEPSSWWKNLYQNNKRD
ncbi:MAG: HD domain-containing protein [Candidatus Zambryskibacteria bacterium]|nr:HD domain-containing protein [Candidatus Zambryskibacteria bacterium]